MSQVEESLRRLQTEYFDLYYPHHPDPQTPVEETMRAFDDLIRAGKVRHIGLSDVAAWQAVEALWVAERKGLNLPVVLQVLFNMLYREPEEELLPVCDRFGLSLVAFSPLAGGVLSGIYRRGAAAPVGSRGSITSTTSGRPAATPVLTDENLAFVEKVAAFALAHGHTTAQVALAWLLAHEPVASVICGAGSVTELEESVRAADLVLSAEDMQQL
jgi:aryl-alcohol dehydrogenase-like predicted oxidoreductase